MNFQIETHNFCNFTCGYCPNKDMERKREFMTDEAWHRIVLCYIAAYKEVNRHCTPTVIVHKDSEPLIDRKLLHRLTFLSNVCPDVNIDIYSNGVLLPAWAKRGEDLFEALAKLPNRVRYLMSYHPRNHDDSVNDYGPTVEYLAKILQAPPSNVEFITVSHKSRWVTEAHQEAWRRTWARLPITVHSNCSINPWTGRIEEEGTIKFNGCPYGDFGHWFFGCTGNVVACCLDLEEEVVLGNVMKDDPAVLFARTDAFYAEQRRTLAEKRRVNHPVCANCFGQERGDALIQLGMQTAT